jgi:cytochrome P450
MTGAVHDELRIDPERIGLYTRPDYYDLLARLRHEAPVLRYAPGSYTVACYEDVREISRDPERFCSGRGVLIHDPLRSGGGIDGSLIHMDPPQHAVWRRVVSRRFTPRAVSRLETRVREQARVVLDALAPGDTVDVLDAIAAPFPVLVIAELLGVGHGDRDDFRRWSDAAISTPDAETPALDDLAALHRFLVEHVKERRAHAGGDVVSELVTADVGGRPMSTAEAVGYCLTLLVAGNETTRHLVSGSVLTLFEHPDQRALLAREPARIGGAVEECLRWVTPVQAFGRTATRDTEVHGTRLTEGDWVVLLYASANRDESVYGPSAARFDVTRPVDNAHLAFGFGEHACLGAALARLEGRVMLEELLARFPDYEVAGDPRWTASTLVRGLESLPVTL